MKNKLKYLIAIVMVVIFSSSITAYASPESEVVPEAAASTEENFFTAVYEEISAYASEILCGLTLAASLILAFSYKKGLMPLVQGALLSIGNAVTKIGDSTKTSEEKATKLEESIENSIRATNDVLDSVIKRIDDLNTAISARLRDDERVRDEYEKLSVIVEGQIDMLYDIFMSSALPQYQKDAVGKRIGKMKETIAKNECAE